VDASSKISPGEHAKVKAGHGASSTKASGTLAGGTPALPPQEGFLAGPERLDSLLWPVLEYKMKVGTTRSTI